MIQDAGINMQSKADRLPAAMQCFSFALMQIPCFIIPQLYYCLSRVLLVAYDKFIKEFDDDDDDEIKN